MFPASASSSARRQPRGGWYAAIIGLLVVAFVAGSIVAVHAYNLYAAGIISSTVKPPAPGKADKSQTDKADKATTGDKPHAKASATPGA
jgi:hypothetical protein